MSSVGYPDWQKITQWLGAPVVEATGLAIGAGNHDDGPFALASWASVILAIKPTGGTVTATIKQTVSGGPVSLELDTVFVVPAGQTAFEAVVLLADAVSLHLAGGGVGTTVDYALYPSNSTTNVAALGTSGVNIPVVALAAFPPAGPVDGQAVLLELPAAYDPVGGKKIRWLLGYNNADAVWDFGGGPPLYAEVQTAESSNLNAGYGDLATVGPAIALPRPGDYMVDQGFWATPVGGTTKMAYSGAGIVAADADACIALGISGAATGQWSVVRSREKAALTAATVTAKYQTDNGANRTFQSRFLEIVPVRIT